jgi:uncharacterized OsmC-like protein
MTYIQQRSDCDIAERNGQAGFEPTTSAAAGSLGCCSLCHIQMAAMKKENSSNLIHPLLTIESRNLITKKKRTISIKVIQATPFMAGMTKVEVKKFLESRLNMRLGTVDEVGDPNIHLM